MRRRTRWLQDMSKVVAITRVVPAEVAKHLGMEPEARQGQPRAPQRPALTALVRRAAPAPASMQILDVRA